MLKLTSDLGLHAVQSGGTAKEGRSFSTRTAYVMSLFLNFVAGEGPGIICINLSSSAMLRGNLLNQHTNIIQHSIVNILMPFPTNFRLLECGIDIDSQHINFSVINPLLKRWTYQSCGVQNFIYYPESPQVVSSVTAERSSRHWKIKDQAMGNRRT